MCMYVCVCYWMKRGGSLDDDYTQIFILVLRLSLFLSLVASLSLMLTLFDDDEDALPFFPSSFFSHHYFEIRLAVRGSIQRARINSLYTTAAAAAAIVINSTSISIAITTARKEGSACNSLHTNRRERRR
jgi:hypothetical protein